MKSNPMSLEDELTTLDKKCKLLLRGEWLSLVLSGVGTVVAAITNQAVFAATPLTCSLFLNILSRSHQDRRVYDQSSQNLIELQRQYASKLQGLRSEFLGIDFSDEEKNGLGYHESFEDLVTKVKQLESFLEIQGGDYYSQGGAINQEISILRNHQLEMDKAVETLTRQMEAGIPEGAEHHDIVDHLERLSSAIYELEQKTAALAEEGGEPVSVNGSMPSEGSVRQDLEPIQSQMLALEERMNMIATADPAYDPETLQSDLEALIQPLRQQISGLEERIQEVRISNEASAELLSDQRQPEDLNNHLTELQAKLESAVAQVAADTREFQNSLQNTHEQMDQIHVRMNSIQDQISSNSVDAVQHQIEAISAPLREQLNELQTQLADINQLWSQLDQVKALAQQSSEALSSDSIQHQVSEATAPLFEKITSVEEKVHAQANQDFTGQLHQVIEPLQSHMVSLEQRINQLASESDRTPLLNQIATLQEHLQTVESRLSAVPQPADYSAELRQVSEKVAQMQRHLDNVSQTVSEKLAEIPQVIENNVEEKTDFLSELQALSFEEEITSSKQQTESELDSLLDALNF